MRKIIPVLLLVLLTANGARTQKQKEQKGTVKEAGSYPTFYYVVTSVDANGMESNPTPQVVAALKGGMTTGVTLRWTNGTPTGNQAQIVKNNIYRTSISGNCTNTSLGSVQCPKIGEAPVGAGGLTYVDPFVAPPASSGLTATVS